MQGCLEGFLKGQIMNFDETNYQQHLVALSLEFFSLPNVDAMYQECLENGIPPRIYLRDNEKVLFFPVKVFSY
jgi:hypothetical protein